MKIQTTKKIGAVIGTVALVGAGTAAATPALTDTVSPASTVATQASERQITTNKEIATHLQGSFNFNQDKVSSTTNIAEVFSKAAAALCDGLPNYGMTTKSNPIAVSGDINNSFEATVNEMKTDAEAGVMTMACACASNMPGGGAIVNAEVSGVSLESIAKTAGA
ncbi:MAG: hypothetical protein RR360_06965 [Raoultibacter sp.]